MAIAERLPVETDTASEVAGTLVPADGCRRGRGGDRLAGASGPRVEGASDEW